MAKRKKKQQAGWIMAAVLTVLLAAVLAAVLPGKLQERQRAQAALEAGVQHDRAEIPRNTYGMDGFSLENDRVSYRDESRSTVTGIDVSSHQDAIDWAAVAGDGIDFAIIQAGYRGYSDGELSEDVRFRENLSGAKNAGLKTGVYFFSQALNEEEARREAEFVLELLDGEALDLPVFYDWERVEYDTARTDAVDGATITACAKVFCETIEAGGYDAGVYFNQNYVYTLIDLAQLLDYPLWMAQYQSVPDFFYDFDLWQYTDSGSVAGIGTPVDLNVRFIE